MSDDDQLPGGLAPRPISPGYSDFFRFDWASRDAGRLALEDFLTPAMLELYEEEGFTAAEAAGWSELLFSPDWAAYYRDRGWTPHQTKLLLSEPAEGFDPEPWTESGLPPARVLKLLAARIGHAEARAWDHIAEEQLELIAVRHHR